MNTNNMRRRPGTGSRHQWLNRLSPCRPFSAECRDRPAGRAGGCVSGVARRLPDQASAPFRPECIAALWVLFVEIHRVDDAVGSKTAKILAQFAPGRQKPHRLEIADGNRPDGALAVTTVFVAITQRDLLSLVNMRA